MPSMLTQVPPLARSLHIGPITIVVLSVLVSLAIAAVVLVLFLFLDGATRGRFPATLLVIMGAAFVGTCVAIVQLQ